MELSTLANVATDDQPYLDFLSGYSVFNIGPPIPLFSRSARKNRTEYAPFF
jgi:hypothetical protein